MAARVLLLGILFTEVLRPACSAGIRVNGVSTKIGSKLDGLEVVAYSRSSGDGGVGTDTRSRDGDVVVGRRGVLLTCVSHGNEISWILNDRPLPSCEYTCCGPSCCSMNKNGSLRIYNKKIRKRRQGNCTVSTKINKTNEYRCNVTFPLGGSVRTSPRKVFYAQVAHEFSELPQDLTVYEGEVSRFACSIDSIPAPLNITWLHNERSIQNNPNTNNKTKYIFISTGVLYIRETTVSDAGTYRCVATNRYLNTSKKTTGAILTVISKKEYKVEHKPASLFPQTSSSYFPLKGTSLRLACAASGYPTPTTTWSFISKDAGANTVVGPRTILSSNSGLAVLDLKNVTVTNSGVYICSMKNSTAQNFQMQNVTIEVFVPPFFVKYPTHQVCPNGRTTRFECQAQGFPTPRIYWLKNSEVITIAGRKSLYTKENNKVELAISATVPSDSGIYQCVAVNAAGESWAAAHLQVTLSDNSPAAPTSLKCEARSPEKMFISWEPPKFLPVKNITAYTVHYRSVEEGGKEEVSLPEAGDATSIEVTKLLEPFTNYTFYVRLWNNHGASDQSETITCATKASVPKAAPKVSVNIISSSKLEVTWTPLTKKEARGIVTEYKLEWRISQHPSVHVRNLPGYIEKYILPDLTPGEKYDIRVLARTEQGWPTVRESYFNWVTVTMPLSNELTQIQALIVNSTSIKLKWNLRTNSRLQYTSWKLYCKNVNSLIINSVDLTKSTNEHIFTNLESNSSYNIELCAINEERGTLHCSAKNVTLKGISVDNVPTGLEAVPISSNSISLSWLSGGINESNGFEACYHSVHFLNESSTCIPVNSTKIIITNLKPFTLYQFKVRALANNTGKYYSETIECYTNEDVPGKVEDIEWYVDNRDKNKIKVPISWRQPNKINGVIQNYVVSYSTDQFIWRNVMVLGNKTSTSLQDLVPGKTYHVYVRASTKAGFGNASNPITFTIGGKTAETTSSLDEQRHDTNTREGVILGVVIAMVFVVFCLCYVYCRRKYDSMRSLRETAQPVKSRLFQRRFNPCCDNDSSSSVSQPAIVSNDIELAVLRPPKPIPSNPHCDTKGGDANSGSESCAKEPLLAPQESNKAEMDLRITENPQYKPRETKDTRKSPSAHEMADMNTTQQTTLNYDLAGSDESLSNKVGCSAGNEGETLSQKTVPAIVPVLEPNG